jgi:hypothetical protein
MIVFLHGSAEGANWKSPTTVNASVPVLGSLPDLPFVVVFPLMRGSTSISALAERDVMDTIADVQADYAIDPARVHLTGLSFGGFAALRVACRYPHFFASLTVFCGGGEPELAVNLRHVPTRIYHGTLDQHVPVSLSREMATALRQADIPVSFTEEPQGRHAVWKGVLDNRLLYKWMGDQVRVSHPRRISYRTYTLRHASAYWATIESMLDPAIPAYIDVFVPPGGGAIHVHAENVGRLLLDPPAALAPAEGDAQFIVNNEAVSATRTERGWVLHLAGGSEGVLVKRPGLSGPIQDVFNDTFVVSVMTCGKADVVPKWQQAALQGFLWTQRLETSNVSPLAPDQVTPEVMSDAHLVCVGDVSTHPLLGRLVEQLPLSAYDGRVFLEGQPLSPSVAAFVMIYPNPLAADRYIVVCSGEPVAAGHLAGLVLTPPTLSPPPVEDLVLVDRAGRIIPWGPSAATGAGVTRRMGERVPGRGPVFDRNWQLTEAARVWMRSLEAAGDGVGGGVGAPAGSPRGGGR